MADSDSDDYLEYRLFDVTSPGAMPITGPMDAPLTYHRKARIEVTPNGFEITPVDDPNDETLQDVEVVPDGKGGYELKMRWHNLSDDQVAGLRAAAGAFETEDAEIQFKAVTSASRIMAQGKSGEVQFFVPSGSGIADATRVVMADLFGRPTDLGPLVSATNVTGENPKILSMDEALRAMQEIAAEHGRETLRIVRNLPAEALYRDGANEDETPPDPHPPIVRGVDLALADGDWTTITRHDLRYPRTNAQRMMHVSHNRSSVVVVALTADDEYLTVRQWKHGIGRMTVEFPAGYLETEREDPVMAAARELAEETGYTSDRMLYLGAYYRDPGQGRTTLHVCVALDCRQSDKGQRLDETEDIRADRVGRTEIERMMHDGRMPSMHCLVAWAAALPYIDEETWS